MNLFLASRLWSDVSDPHPARPTPRDPVLSLNANHNLEWLRNLTPIASQYTPTYIERQRIATPTALAPVSPCPEQTPNDT